MMMRRAVYCGGKCRGRTAVYPSAQTEGTNEEKKTKMSQEKNTIFSCFLYVFPLFLRRFSGTNFRGNVMGGGRGARERVEIGWNEEEGSQQLKIIEVEI